MRVEEFANRLKAKRRSNGQWIAHCPVPNHGRDGNGDRNPSLSISEGRDGRILIKCFAGCSPDAVVAAMGLSMKDLFSDDKAVVSDGLIGEQDRNRPLSDPPTYIYTDAQGRPVHGTVRFDNPKRFGQAHFDPDTGRWYWGLNGVDTVLYRLPRVIEAIACSQPIFLVEGEKDVETLETLGLVATTNPSGAANWKQEYNEMLRGADVIICPDQDEPGIQRAHCICSGLLGVAKSIRIYNIPSWDGMPHGADVTDYINQFKLDREAFLASVREHETGVEQWSTGSSHCTSSARDTDAKDDDYENPLEQLKVPAFPTQVMTQRIADIMNQFAIATDGPVDFVGTAMLVCAAAAIGTRARVRVKSTWEHFPTLFACLIGRSGTGKSDAISFAKRPLEKLNKQLIQEYYRQKEAYEAELELAKSKKDGDKPEPPVPRVLITNDATIQAVVEMLFYNKDGIIYIDDELRGWLGGMERYNRGGGGDEPRYLSLWNGDPVTVNRKGRDPIYVDNACLCVLGGIQPWFLKELQERGQIKDGLFARMLVVQPECEINIEFPEEDIPQSLIDAWEAIIFRLREITNVFRVYSLTPDAYDAYKHYFRQLRIEKRDAADEDYGYSIDKMSKYCCRLSLVVHLLRRADGETNSDQIDLTSMQAAIALSRYFLAHARSVFDTMHMSASEQKLAEWAKKIKRHGGDLTFREMYKDHKIFGRNVKAMDAEKYVEELQKHGYGTIYVRPTPGKATKAFRLKE
ncbi:MAG TPA: DUF3987 domain-containing protein [Firmicutes bacterium]|nr:DUF3987 domain-containing protein [Bacillota bacterium]